MIVFISGPPASGKSRYSKQLRDFYGCEHIYDGFPTHNEIIRPHTLVLTQVAVLGAIPINEALRNINVEPLIS